MLRWISTALILLLGPPSSQMLSPGEIFEQNKEAVVRIFTPGDHTGCGFVISPDGLIVTANHVITTEESQYTEVASTIEVEKLGDKRSHIATVVAHSNRSDTALIRIIAAELHHTTLGDSNTIKPSDAATIVTFLPNPRQFQAQLLLIGNVSGTGMVNTGKASAKAIFFQMPVRKGFSGSPIFDSRGQVIGIVNTRLIGISPDLDIARKDLNAYRNQGMQISMGSTDIGKTFLGLINSLDADLVSGLGSAVDISYAKEMQAEIQAGNTK